MQLATWWEQQKRIDQQKANPKEELAKGCKNMSPDSKGNANNMLNSCQVEKKVQKLDPMNSRDFTDYLAKNGENLNWKSEGYKKAIFSDFQHEQKFWQKWGQDFTVLKWGESNVRKIGTNLQWSESWVIYRR